MVDNRKRDHPEASEFLLDNPRKYQGKSSALGGNVDLGNEVRPTGEKTG
jgi:hypothetical protein